MIKNNDYWKKRELAEKKWQMQVENNIQSYNQRIVQMYQNAIDDINRQIKSDLAFSGGKLVTAKGMQEFETLAKEAVKKANELRKNGHHVTRKDFSKDVNNRLKIYNATMRINRNEMLKSKIGVRLVDLGVEQEADLTKKLWNAYIKEKERQAGILKVTAKSNLWTSKEVQEQIAKQIGGANFSQRIWANVDSLKGQLDGLISSAIIRGENPVKMARWLVDQVSDTVTNQRYAAERLARTETARVQFEAQKMSILDNGYKYVKWIAEGAACKICRAIADKDNGFDEYGVYKAKDIPDIPVHPNCMCSISAYWVDDKNKLNDSDLQALNNYISSDSYKINSYLRENTDPNTWGESFTKQINALDTALNKVSTYKENQPLQRDYFFMNEEKKDFANKLLESKFFQDTAYLSTSKEHYGEGMEQVHFIIEKSFSGHDISSYNDQEQEVLFPRNTKFKITKYYVNNSGILSVVLEELK